MRWSSILTLFLVSGCLLFPCEAQITGSKPKPTIQTPVLPVLEDGPHLFHRKDGSVTAKWVHAGKIVEKRFAAGKPIELPEFEALLGKSLKLAKHTPPASTWPMPKKLFIISDVEGEYDAMFRFLKANRVVDKNGKWAFGKGHFVCVGDMVDRGQKVTETLWMLYRLSRESLAAGGRLHYVLGNHEVMIMAGDVRYMAPKYKRVAALFGIPPRGIVGADTEIGRWMRAQNSLTRVGDYLFVHAGVSPPLAPGKVDLAGLNVAIRSVLGTPPLEIQDKTLQAIAWGTQGPLWYRGYFKEWSLSFGPTPTSDQMDAILKNLGAKTIVIGHTKVAQVTAIYDKRRVLAIDVPWTDAKKVRGLLVQGDRIDVVDVNGKRTEFK